MELLDTIDVSHKARNPKLMLFAGDLTRLPSYESVDALVVSAFPDDYSPTSTSVIGSLARAGVSVAQLAADKEVDLRRFSSCWLSRPVAVPNLHFRRVLCFEPRVEVGAAELVGDIFRSIVPFTGPPAAINSLAMPLVGAGNAGERPEVVLEALASAAVHWLSTGLPLDRIKIVLHSSANTPSTREAFARVKRRDGQPVDPPRPDGSKIDAFISYSHRDRSAVDEFVKALSGRRPSLRVFVDRLELQPGASWQQQIFEALGIARKVLCMYSPDYLASKVCQEEFNMAVMRHREENSAILLPVYLRSAELPVHMKYFQYVDAREGEAEKLASAAARLIDLI